jgi:hypothetical protein
MRLSLPGPAAVAVAAAALALPPPAPAADSVFGGTTRSGDPIVVKADAKLAELRSAVIGWRAPCGDGRRYGDDAVLEAVDGLPGFAPAADELLVSRNARGRFKGSQLSFADLGTATAAVSVELAGKLARTRASGTLSAIVKVADKATGAAITSCQTGTVSWAAARAPGIVYGGATSQGAPFVARLNAARERVADVLMSWHADCTSGAFVRFPERFVGFALKRTGGFGNPIRQEFDVDTGGKRLYDYRLAGRVTRAAAKGSLRVMVTETDAAGAAIDSCDTGALTWKAATG